MSNDIKDELKRKVESSGEKPLAEHKPAATDPTALQMIYNSQLRMEKKMDVVCGQVGENAVDIERNHGMIYTERERINNLVEEKEALKKHLDDEEIHFNKEKAAETNLGYLAKKKLLYLLIGTLSTVLSLITAWLAIQMQVPVGP